MISLHVLKCLEPLQEAWSPIVILPIDDLTGDPAADLLRMQVAVEANIRAMPASEMLRKKHPLLVG